MAPLTATAEAPEPLSHDRRARRPRHTRLRRPPRSRQDDLRRRRPRGRMLGPRSTATSAASGSWCGSPSPPRPNVSPAASRHQATPSPPSRAPWSRVVVRSARELRDHEALQFLFALEPELVLPHLTFDAGNRFLVGVRRRLAPLRRFLPARAPTGPANGSRAVLTSRSLTHTPDRSDRRSRSSHPGAPSCCPVSSVPNPSRRGLLPWPARTRSWVATDVDDLEAILAVTNTDVNEVEHLVKSNGDAIFTWDYDRSRPALAKLYEKAKTSQWNARPTCPGTPTSTRSTSSCERAGQQHDVRQRARPEGHAVREVG